MIPNIILSLFCLLGDIKLCHRGSVIVRRFLYTHDSWSNTWLYSWSNLWLNSWLYLRETHHITRDQTCTKLVFELVIKLVQNLWSSSWSNSYETRVQAIYKCKQINRYHLYVVIIWINIFKLSQVHKLIDTICLIVQFV